MRGVFSSKRMVFLGMYPWDYNQLTDTVRFMALHMEGAERYFINPFVNHQRFYRKWRVKKEGGVSVLTPPYGFIPTRYGLYHLRDRVYAGTLEQFFRKHIGGQWQENSIFYLTSSSIEQGYQYVNHLRPGHIIFDIVDDNLGFPGISEKKREALTQKFITLAKRATVLTAVSEYLVKQTEALVGCSVKYLPNGVDVDRFRPSKTGSVEPTDLRNIPHPRLCFLGALTGWVDFSLLWKVAHHFPDASLVLIGPYFEESVDRDSFSRLMKMDNVYWLGAKPYSDVPGYLHHSDVLLLPRTYDPYSVACDPLKLYEYLATGKPVVTTAIPSAQRFQNVLEIGRDDEEFIAGIRMSLKKGINDQQISLIESLSWKARVNKMKGFIESLL